ncbi:MAG: hypothetical protein IPN74_16075 [Haliscomenobacter sp.]|nr:hypothetical protein [Haliscomenobacter sp.]
MQLFRNQLIHQAGIPATSERKIIYLRVLAFVLITLIAIILRLYVSFSHDLILGVDGGYYPLQVRNILNTGFLSFNDVPLYFYFCASIVKVLSVLGFTMPDESIISVIKIVDSVALPLLAIPLFKMVTRKESPVSNAAAMAILSYAVLSFTPFFILGDLQKNAFAIPLAFIFILFWENYLINPVRRNKVAVVISLAVIALSHFGVFAFCLAFIIVSLFIVYRKKAILPSLIIFLFGIGLIALFDYNRAFRLITFWNVVFERPALFQGSLQFPLLLNFLFSYFLAVFGILQFRRFKSKSDKVSEYMVLTLIVLLAVFAFPVYDQQYFERFNVLLFIPQLLLIAYLIRMNQKLALPFSISLVLLTTFSIFMYFSEEKKPCIDDQTFHDLQNIHKYVAENKENSIIIARHGLEFWTAWALNVNVVQDRAMDKIGLEKYSIVIFLQQKNEDKQGPFGRRPLHKPEIGMSGSPPMGRPVPGNFKLIYSSSYLNAYQKMK